MPRPILLGDDAGVLHLIERPIPDRIVAPKVESYELLPERGPDERRDRRGIDPARKRDAQRHVGLFLRGDGATEELESFLDIRSGPVAKRIVFVEPHFKIAADFDLAVLP